MNEGPATEALRQLEAEGLVDRVVVVEGAKDAAMVEERLQRADSNKLIEANRNANLSLISISKQGVDVARNCLRTIATDDTHDSQVDLRLRELWSECEWLMQDMAKLYGERFYVAELPPIKATLKGQLHSERL
jgi:L-fucose mutarotase/ribose pyranase (RbsD/FucU family)